MRRSRTLYELLGRIAVVIATTEIAALPAAADIDKGEYEHTVATRSAENERLLAECPYIALRDDLFARYVRDPRALPVEGDVIIDPTWVIVQPRLNDVVAVRMAAMLAQFFDEVMGLPLAVVAKAPDSGAMGSIQLYAEGGGQADVPESFTVSVVPGMIRVAGIDVPGLRDGVTKLIDLFGFRMAPFLQPQDVTYTPRIAMRRSATVPQHEMVVLLGSNAVGVGAGELYAYSKSDAIPELAIRRVPGALEAMAASAKAATEAGLQAHTHVGIRTKFPKDDPVFKAHPEIRGALTWSEDGEYNLCTEHPLVKQYFQESIEDLFKGVPDLQGIEIIIGGENFYHCFMRPYPHVKGHTNCERCEALGPDVVVSNLVNYLAEAARRVNPKAIVEAWPYSAVSLWSADAYQTGLIQRLGPGTAILTESVKDTLIEKPFGIKKLLWDYSIDMIGPSPRAMRQIELCNERGVPTTVLSMYEMSFEAALLPEIPCMDRWAARADALAGSGADGAYLWKMGPYYGGFSAEVYKHFMWSPAPEQDELLGKLAARVAGVDAGPHMREAWRNVSEAIGWSPEIATYYKGPLYLGPAHPMIADRSAKVPEVFDGYYLFLAEAKLSDGLKAHPTYFVDAPGGDKVDGFLKSYQEMKRFLEIAVAELERAAPLVPEQNRVLFESQAYPIRWLYHSVRTQCNFSRSCLIRDELMPLTQAESLTPEQKSRAAELYAEWRNVLVDELDNTRVAAPIARADARLDFYYRGDHMFNHLWDMVDAKIELLEHEIDVFLPSVAERCGVNVKEDAALPEFDPTNSIEFLSEGDRPALVLDHFPTRLHAFVWRNWQLVPLETMAQVVDTTPEVLATIGRRMGLTGPPEIAADQLRRSYTTIIRRNWHLLPVEQLEQLLGWSREKLDYVLREDDFLFIKLGALKPICEPLIYDPSMESHRDREIEIARVVHAAFGQDLGELDTPLFGFLDRFNENAPKVAPRESMGGPPRFCYSYFAPYGDSLVDPALAPYPDTYLSELADAGVNGVWLQAVLYTLAPFPWDEHRSEGYETRLANLNDLVARAGKYGIGVYLYLNEPRAMPDRFFEAHPHLKGAVDVREKGHASLCTSVPEVRQYLTDATARICRAVPDIAGFFSITFSENWTHCWAHSHETNVPASGCPRCAQRDPATVIAEVNNAIKAGIDEAGSGAHMIAWDWIWPAEWLPKIIEQTVPDVAIMSVSEWGIPISRQGVDAAIGEYSLIATGAGPRATRSWDLAREHGLKSFSKNQIGTTWELSAVPYIPVVENVARHAGELRARGLDGYMTGWTLGGYPSANLEVFNRLVANPGLTIENAMQSVAERRFGQDCAGAMVEAWRAYSAAFQEYPFDVALLYFSPLQAGPSNLLWKDSTGYSATMVGIPYDAIDMWHREFPPDVLRGQLDLIADRFDQATQRLRLETDQVNSIAAPQKQALHEAMRIAEVCAIHFRSTANQFRFVEARNAVAAGVDDAARAGAIAAIEASLRLEVELSRQLYLHQQADSRIGFEATNQYMYVPVDLAEKVLNCTNLLDHWLPTL